MHTGSRRGAQGWHKRRASFRRFREDDEGMNEVRVDWDWAFIVIICASLLELPNLISRGVVDTITE